MESRKKEYWVKLEGQWYCFTDRAMAVDFFMEHVGPCSVARLEERVVLAEKDNKKQNEKENKPY